MAFKALGKTILERDQFSDYTIICQGVSFRVHRNVICGASSSLNQLCASSFEEAAMQKVTYNDFIPSIMARVIFYIYTGSYESAEVPSVFQSLCKDPEMLDHCPLTDAFEIHGARQEQGDVEMAEGHQAAESGASADTISTAVTKNASATSGKDSATTEQQEVDRKARFKALKVDVLVYKVADYLGIEDLVKLAADRFVKGMKDVYLLDGFANPLRVMFETLPQYDQGLKQRVVSFLAEKHEKLSDRASVNGLMSVHTDGFWSIYTKKMSEKQTAHQQALTKELKYLSDTLRQNDVRCKHKRPIILELEEPTGKKGRQWKLTTPCTYCTISYP